MKLYTSKNDKINNKNLRIFSEKLKKMSQSILKFTMYPMYSECILSYYNAGQTA